MKYVKLFAMTSTWKSEKTFILVRFYLALLASIWALSLILINIFIIMCSLSHTHTHIYIYIYIYKINLNHEAEIFFQCSWKVLVFFWPTDCISLDFFHGVWRGWPFLSFWPIIFFLFAPGGDSRYSYLLFLAGFCFFFLFFWYRECW